jgi:hypothetical protein
MNGSSHLARRTAAALTQIMISTYPRTSFDKTQMFVMARIPSLTLLGQQERESCSHVFLVTPVLLE